MMTPPIPVVRDGTTFGSPISNYVYVRRRKNKYIVIGEFFAQISKYDFLSFFLIQRITRVVLPYE